MVGTVGFEPTTSASRTLRAAKLRHVPICAGRCALKRGETSRVTAVGRKNVRSARVSRPLLTRQVPLPIPTRAFSLTTSTRTGQTA